MSGPLRFRLLLPAVWGLGCLMGHQSPGDEYFLFAVGSFVGAWAGILVAGDVQSLVLPVLLAGCLVMVGLGYVLDLLRGSLVVWLPAWIASGIALFFVALSSFESIEAAIAKNGSLLAYAICASQLGVYFATVLTLATAAVRRYAAMLGKDLAGQRS